MPHEIHQEKVCDNGSISISFAKLAVFLASMPVSTT